MEYVKLGCTGMDVSRISLGCLTYGDPERGKHPWSQPEEPYTPRDLAGFRDPTPRTVRSASTGRGEGLG